MPGLRSLRNRLAVIFALIILGAIGTIYLSVTPRLEASLTSQRARPGARDRARSTRPRSAQFLCPARDVLPGATTVPKTRGRGATTRRDRADASADRALAERIGTEIIVMSATARTARSCSRTRRRTAARPAATSRASRARRCGPAGWRRAIVTTANGRQALAAELDRRRATSTGRARTSPSSRTRWPTSQDNVALIRRQVLLSGGIALVIAILAGYLVARALAARVKRLERAARKVAARRLLAADQGRLRRRARPARAPRSTTCRTSSRGWTGRASSSSPPPRTSCARRSSRSAASSSCWPTRTSTRRRGARSWSRSAARSTGCATWPSSCSTSRGWRRARWSCGPSRPTSASSRARSRRSSRRPRRSTSPT